MTFNEDFDDFDTDTWGTAYPWNGGTGGTNPPNHEEQWYLKADFAQANGTGTYVAHDGVLDINAAPTTAALSGQVGGQPYTSGMITTDPSFSQTYGYFEMRAALPAGQGVWSAFWLLPTDYSWPPEIDVVETIGSEPDTLNTTVHYGADNRSQGKATELEGLTGDGQFHTYGVDWQADDITWYLDGKEVFQAATPAGFDKPMYILANLAVGGDWPGSPDGTTQFPSTMSIDYIRAYSNDPNAVPAASQPETTPTAPVPVADAGTTPPATPVTAPSPVADAGGTATGGTSGADAGTQGNGHNGGPDATPPAPATGPVSATPGTPDQAPVTGGAPAAGTPVPGGSSGTDADATTGTAHAWHGGWHHGDSIDLGAVAATGGNCATGGGKGAWHDLIQDALGDVSAWGGQGHGGASAFHDMVRGIVGAAEGAASPEGSHHEWTGGHDLSALADAFGHGHAAHGHHA